MSLEASDCSWWFWFWIKMPFRKKYVPWVAWLSWVGCPPLGWKVVRLASGQGTYPGCSFDPQSGCIQEGGQLMFLSHINVSLCLSCGWKQKSVPNRTQQSWNTQNSHVLILHTPPSLLSSPRVLGLIPLYTWGYNLPSDFRSPSFHPFPITHKPQPHWCPLHKQTSGLYARWREIFIVVFMYSLIM